MPFISYFITDPSFSLKEILNAVKKHKPSFVCYRNKHYFDKKEIIEFAKAAKKHSKIIIHYDSLKNDGLLRLFDGIHFPSGKIGEIEKYKNILSIASTHTLEEVLKAKNADYITFSPIYDSKNRPGLGTAVLNEIYNYHKNVIALGGITTEEKIEEVKKTKAKGFASIRYFLT